MNLTALQVAFGTPYTLYIVLLAVGYGKSNINQKLTV